MSWRKAYELPSQTVSIFITVILFSEKVHKELSTMSINRGVCKVFIKGIDLERTEGPKYIVPADERVVVVEG